MSADFKRKKILVVGDEPDMRIILCNLLGNCGFHSIGARDRIEGLQKAKAEKPALIILDVMMPRESGILMYRQLRDDDILKHVPVIMVSSIDKKTFSRYQKLHGGSQAHEPGAYLEMPIQTEELVRLVREMLKADAGQAADSPGD